MEKRAMIRTLLLASLLLPTSLMLGCGNKAGRHYDIWSDSSEFIQSASYKPRKVDILWVIDNSGSMKNSQENLAASFQSFINRFKQLDSDFHMAVTTTEAYKAQYSGNMEYSRIKDGNPDTGASGYRVLNKELSEADLNDAFIKNIMQGIKGSGDERAFQSLANTLLNPDNSDFRRPDAFLAVIIVSDEEDFSHDASNHYDKRYNTLHTPQSYVDFLADFTKSNPIEDFSVSSIAIFDEACLSSLKNNAQRIGARLEEIADLTGGIKASLCNNFGESLEIISDSIVELAAAFKLHREPIVETITVRVDGKDVPQSENDGWVYVAESNSIKFNGTAVPQQGAAVDIDFDPKELKK